MANLYIVATPIGNLSDISKRAVETLENADIVAAEDTRHTIGLLNHFGISKRLISYHEYSDEKKANALLDYIEEGKNVALVSDAGTPLVSDPGLPLVTLAKHRGIKVVPVPGACAAVTAFCASGVKNGRFLFYGFLEAKSAERKKELERIKSYDVPVILYESPHRLLKTLNDIMLVCGEQTRITAARELTKVHEEFFCGSARQVYEEFSGRESVKGEFVLILEFQHEKTEITDEYILKKIEEYLKEGISKKDAVKTVSKELDIPKNKVYELATK